MLARGIDHSDGRLGVGGALRLAAGLGRDRTVHELACVGRLAGLVDAKDEVRPRRGLRRDAVAHDGRHVDQRGLGRSGRRELPQ